MEYFFILYFSVLGLYFLLNLKLVKKSGLRKSEVTAIYFLHLLLGIGTTKIMEWVYPNPGTFRFNNMGYAEHKILMDNPVEFVSEFFRNSRGHYGNFFGSYDSFWNDLGEKFLFKFLGFSNFFAQGIYSINQVFIITLNILALVLLFRVFNDAFPKKRTGNIIGVFLVPSVIVFGGMVFKDYQILQLLCIFTYAMYFGCKNGFTIKKIVLLILSFTMILLIRNYIAVLLFPAAMAYILSKSFKLRPSIAFFTVYALGAAVLLSVQIFSNKIDIISIIAKKQHDLLYDYKSDSDIKTHVIERNIQGIIKAIPNALNNSFLKPVNTDSNIKSIIPFALENSAYLLLFLSLLYLYDKTYLRNNALLLFGVFFTFSTFLIIGLTVSKLAVLVRYKSPLLVLVLPGLFALIDGKKLTGKFYPYFFLIVLGITSLCGIFGLDIAITSLFFIFYSIIGLLIIKRLKIVRQTGLSESQVRTFYFLKIISGIVLAVGMMFTLKDNSYFDANQFGIEEYKLLMTDPKEFVAEFFRNSRADYGHFFDSFNSFWNDLGEKFLFKMLGIINIFTQGSYFLNSIFINFVNFICSCLYYQVFRSAFPKSKPVAIIGAFLIPSTVFFSSAIFKDALIYQLLGIYLYALYFGVRKFFDPAKIFWLLFSFIIILLIRNYVAVLLIPPSLAFLLTKRFKKNPWLVFGATYGIILAAVLTLYLSNSKIDFAEVLYKKQRSYLMARKANTEIPVYVLEPNMRSVLAATPTAIKNGILSPNIFQKNTRATVPFAVEWTIYLTLALLSFWFLRRARWIDVSFILLALLFVIPMFLIVGYTINNMGSIVRYRSIYLPLIITPVLAVLASLRYKLK